jgi:membrane-associated protease RseP (regulator of RpoE activity)
LLSLALQGCASTGSPVTQTVRVETPGCVHAVCELRNDRGTWQLSSTPGAVTLTTSNAPLQVSCRAESGALGVTGAPPSVPATTTKGAVAGGIAGGATAGVVFGGPALAFIPVLGVLIVGSSIALGAAAGQAAESRGRALGYPESITVPMSCPTEGAVAAAQPSTGVRLGLDIRGLSSGQSRAAGVGERAAVLVTGVSAGGRAAASGLREGDVILTAGGRELSDAADLEEQVSALVPGAPLTLRVWRNGQVLELTLTRQPVLP